MHFKLGERVVFLHEKGEGVVLKYITDTTVLVEDKETGFERKMLLKDIGKIYGEIPESAVSSSHEHKAADQNQKKKTIDSTPSYITKDNERWEIDLHTHQLLDVETGKTSHQLLQYQFAVFTKCFREARERRVRKLIIIHGVGKGRLRHEIRFFLEGQTGLIYYDADFREYGKGATTVELHYR